MITVTPVSTFQLEETLAFWDDCSLQYKKVREKRNSNPFARFLLANGNSEPIRHILTSLLRRWNAFAIKEDPYFDLEFWDAHAGYYDTNFPAKPRHCTRFHFFAAASDVDQTSQSDLIQNLCDELKRGNTEDTSSVYLEPYGRVDYLGYMVLRPTESYNVGRAAIRFDDREPAKFIEEINRLHNFGNPGPIMHPLEQRGRSYLMVRLNYQANIFSSRLRTNTVEFMQQDPNLGACATASLWVATHVTAEKYGWSKFPYATITRQALGGWSREREARIAFDPMNLDSGLFPSEIQNAIVQTGARPIAFYARPRGQVEQESLRLRQEIYSFVESGMPVILGLDDHRTGEGHSIALVGHHMAAFEVLGDYKRPFSSIVPGIGKDHYLVSTFIPLFYAHDDRYGPFNRLTFTPDGNGETTKDQSILEKLKLRLGIGKNDENAKAKYPIVLLGRSPIEALYLCDAIVPAPPLIRGGTCERMSALLPHFDAVFMPHLKVVFGNKLEILWRTILIEGAAFKRSLVARQFESDIVEWYGMISLPKYVWLFEFSIARDEEEWASLFDSDKARNIAGEFLFDPTVAPDTPRVLAYRIGPLGYRFDEPADIQFTDAPTPKAVFNVELPAFHQCYISEKEGQWDKLKNRAEESPLK